MSVTSVTTRQVRDNSLLDADVASNAAIAGTKIAADFGVQNLIVDTNVLFVNATTNRVGLGTASPGFTLEVSGIVGLSGSGYIDVTSGSTGSAASYWLSRATAQNNFAVNVPSGAFFSWNINNVEKFRLDTNGDFGTGSNGSDSRAAGSVTSSASFFLGVLASDPATPVAGQLWFNNTTKQYMGYDGTSKVILG